VQLALEVAPLLQNEPILQLVQDVEAVALEYEFSEQVEQIRVVPEESVVVVWYFPFPHAMHEVAFIDPASLMYPWGHDAQYLLAVS